MIEPNELHAIKASVAATLSLPALSTVTGEQSLAILDAIDAAAAHAAAQRVIMFDAETGDEILPSESATGPVRVLMAAQLLPGMPAELINKAYSDWLDSDHDPRPFAVGKAVSHRELASLRGEVIKRVESDGELHSVWVRWDRGGEALAYSPRELNELAQ